jgi:hypothetical protein
MLGITAWMPRSSWARRRRPASSNGAASQRVEVFAQLGRDQAQTIQFAMQALRIGGRCLQ